MYLAGYLKGVIRMDKDVKDVVDFWEDEDSDANLWELTTYFDTPVDRKTFEKIFTKEQTVFLGCLLKQIIWALDEWHNKNDEDSHKDIRNKLKKLAAQFRNHRHDTSKVFSGRAEY